MKVVAYSYTDPLWETPPDLAIWGWEVDRIYQDLGERQQLEELLRYCQLEPVNYLLVEKVAILGDSVQQVSDHLQYFQSLGVQVIGISETSPEAQEYQLLAQIQANYRSRQIRQGHARSRLQGAPPPGKAPYGYKRGKNSYILDRQAVPIIKDFFAQFLLYGSLRESVRYLAQKHHKQISPATGKRWLTNPVYRGHTAYRQGETILNTHPPILTKEEAAQIDRLLQRNSNLPPRSASAPRSLAGLVSCAQCQSPMRVSKSTSTTTSKEYLYLRPLRCKKQPKCQLISYESILQQTIIEICHSLPQAVANLSHHRPNMPPHLDYENLEQSLQSQIARQQEILGELTQLTAKGILDAETAQIRAYKLNTEIAKLQGKLASLPPVNLLLVAQAVSLPQFWLDLSEAERRFYFREFIRAIQIVPLKDEWEVRLLFIFG
ncbi:recombinase family protein [Merismopedia glauca CCAP 1448/3]|uniref:Recombinase family protein n=2 Tax=Merismopedia TaxID=53402 RepID=A0A2T1C192_9CYAN|nr:recombinase family protein [Merismopedia glauca CCAP 1448/3]